MKEKEKAQPVCIECRRDLRQGEDVVGIGDGVIGPRGFVPLEDTRFLCTSECIRDYFCEEGIKRVTLPRHVP